MKKTLFVLVLLALCGIVLVATPYEELQYNFPLDEGSNKLCAATIALISAIWGALVNIRKAVLVWGGMILIIALLAKFGIMCFGVGTIFAALVMCAVVFVWADKDEEIKDFLRTPFKEDEDK